MSARRCPDIIEAQLDAAAQACAQQGAQLTELRRRVLGWILRAEGPATAYQLLDRLGTTRKRAAPPTIYRALDFLMRHGLVHKIERLNAFVPCSETGHRHHKPQFLICRQCGAVAEIEDHSVSQALERAAKREGFLSGHAIIEVDGACATCAHPSQNPTPKLSRPGQRS